MPGPRIHRITRPEHNLPAIGSCNPPLNLLLACHESHNEVLHHLKRLPLPSHHGTCPSSPSSSKSTSESTSRRKTCCPYILFNPVLDTLYLPGSGFPLNYRQWFSRAIDFSIIHHLAVDVTWSCQHPTGYDERISIPVIVSRLGSVQHLYIISECSYLWPVEDDSRYQDAISHWGKILPIEGRKGMGERERKVEGDGDGGQDDAGAADGGCWGWVEPVDLKFWEDLTQASVKEAKLATELQEERERQQRGDDSATKWAVPRVEMRFLRLDRDRNVRKKNLTNMTFSYPDNSNGNLRPLQSHTMEALAVDEGPTNQEIITQRWARCHSPRNAGLRFSKPLLERLGLRKGRKRNFKMPYEL
jgi:hypothetical protein